MPESMSPSYKHLEEHIPVFTSPNEVSQMNWDTPSNPSASHPKPEDRVLDLARILYYFCKDHPNHTEYFDQSAVQVILYFRKLYPFNFPNRDDKIVRKTKLAVIWYPHSWSPAVNNSTTEINKAVKDFLEETEKLRNSITFLISAGKKLQIGGSHESQDGTDENAGLKNLASISPSVRANNGRSGTKRWAMYFGDEYQWLKDDLKRIGK